MTSDLAGALLWAFVLLLILALTSLALQPRAKHRRRAKCPPDPTTYRGFCRRKPKWVRQAVIRLKALQPDDGCRAIAAAFNRNYRHRRMTVGKSYVAKIFNEHQLEILAWRRKIRRRKPGIGGKRLIWAADLTYADNTSGKEETIFGLLDHGTRLCLSLQTVKTKASIELVRQLLNTIELCGKPKCLRTDNEPVFTSWIFRLSLAILGIRHQRTQLASPWQNGRVERFFGTFKERLRRRREPLPAGRKAQRQLDVFRFWYNELRPHQSLDGYTPAEIWTGRKPSRGHLRFMTAWQGVLSGFYAPK